MIRAVLCRLVCPEHGVVTEAVPWAEHDSRFTRDFEDLVAWVAREMNKTAVKNLLHIAWATVGNIIERVVARKIDRGRLERLYRVGIDEVSYRKGHKYLTVVADHETGDPVWIGEGRSQATVGAFFDELGDERAKKLGAISMDMCAPYILEAKARAPQAEIAFDPFHVVKLANEAVHDVRRTEARERKGTAEAAVLKGSRWALLKAPESLRAEEHVRLSAVAGLNARVYRAHLLKEELRALYRRGPRSAPEHLRSWLSWASRSNLAPFVKLGCTLRQYRDGVLAAIRLKEQRTGLGPHPRREQTTETSYWTASPGVMSGGLYSEWFFKRGAWSGVARSARLPLRHDCPWSDRFLMCGLSGSIGPSCPGEELKAAGRATIATLGHRGPDDTGIWVDGSAGVVLSHARLSIIDLSSAGHQPMISAGGRYVIVYNGEVYDTNAMRNELEGRGIRFRGYSDTEIILEGCAAWGVEETTRRLVGMFAFALWDREARTLWLVRDRLGIKPIYYGHLDGAFAFASELKALRAHPAFRSKLNRSAMAAFVHLGYIPAPHSIYAGIRKLPPGHILTLRSGADPKLTCYWDLRAVARDGLRDPVPWPDAEAEERLDALLRQAVRLRMVADVPLGAFLSGGIDSSTVVALMQAQSSRPVRTFTIGMREQGYDEAAHAKAVARHLATEHTELYVEPDHAREIVPRLPEWYDEPFADPSQIPTFLVSELTRRHVTVSLSGDGGDELFAGYSRYAWGEAVWKNVRRIPAPLRRLGSRALRGLSPDAWNRLARLLPGRLRPSHVGLKVHKVANVLDAADSAELFRGLISSWQRGLVNGADAPRGILFDRSVEDDIAPFLERMQYLDSVTYLPDDILCKVDRASMAVSLEARVPLLDHRVVELSWRLPRRLKVRDGQGKWLLRRVLYRYVPREIVERPKMGFNVPVGQWLRGPLRDWAEDLLAVEALEENGLFDAAPVRALWLEHLEGQAEREAQLWVVLMAQAWRRHWAV